MPRAPVQSRFRFWRPVFIDADLIPVSRPAPPLRIEGQQVSAITSSEDPAACPRRMAFGALDLTVQKSLWADAQPERPVDLAFDF